MKRGFSTDNYALKKTPLQNAKEIPEQRIISQGQTRKPGDHH